MLSFDGAGQAFGSVQIKLVLCPVFPYTTES